MKTQTLIKNTLLATLVSVAGLTAFAQSTVSVFIPINPKNFEKMMGDDMARLNLLNEAKKLNPALKSVPNLEVQMIRLEAKSGMGGAQVFLRINNKMVDSQSVETNPDILETAYDFQRVELKNIDRALVNEASLVIQSFSNIRLQSLELVMGPVQEPVVFGRYADDQIANIGGVVNASETEGNIDDVRPSAEVIAAITDRYYHQDTDVIGGQTGVVTKPVGANPVVNRPVVSQPVIPNCGTGFELRYSSTGYYCERVVVQQPVTPRCEAGTELRRDSGGVYYCDRVAAQPAPAPVKQCLRNRKAVEICVGDKVKNRWGAVGRVMSIDARRQEAGVKFDFKDKVDMRDVDSLSK